MRTYLPADAVLVANADVTLNSASRIGQAVWVAYVSACCWTVLYLAISLAVDLPSVLCDLKILKQWKFWMYKYLLQACVHLNVPLFYGFDQFGSVYLQK